MLTCTLSFSHRNLNIVVKVNDVLFCQWKQHDVTFGLWCQTYYIHFSICGEQARLIFILRLTVSNRPNSDPAFYMSNVATFSLQALFFWVVHPIVVNVISGISWQKFVIDGIYLFEGTSSDFEPKMNWGSKSQYFRYNSRIHTLIIMTGFQPNCADYTI